MDGFFFTSPTREFWGGPLCTSPWKNGQRDLLSQERALSHGSSSALHTGPHRRTSFRHEEHCGTTTAPPPSNTITNRGQENWTSMMKDEDLEGGTLFSTRRSRKLRREFFRGGHRTRSGTLETRPITSLQAELCQKQARRPLREGSHRKHIRMQFNPRLSCPVSNNGGKIREG